MHFPKLVDRFLQNLRRVAGYDVQYFAAVEPQRRLAPHLHMAIRGTISRAELRQIAAATYHQVWWPSTDDVRFDGDHLPVWDDDAGDLPRPRHRRSPADLGRGARRPRRDEDAEPIARRPLRRPARAEASSPAPPMPTSASATSRST